MSRDKLHDVAQFLHDDPAMDFDYIVHVSSVDWPDDEERFEVVYEFYSIKKRQRIRLKTRVPESDCVVDSLDRSLERRGLHGARSLRHDGHSLSTPPGSSPHPDAGRLRPKAILCGKIFRSVAKGWRDTFEFLDETTR